MLKILLIPETCLILPDINWKPVGTDELKAAQGMTNYSLFLILRRWVSLWGSVCNKWLPFPFGLAGRNHAFSVRVLWATVPTGSQCQLLSHRVLVFANYISPITYEQRYNSQKAAKLKHRCFSAACNSPAQLQKLLLRLQVQEDPGRFQDRFLLSRVLSQPPLRSLLISMKKNRQSFRSHLQLRCSSRTTNWVRFGHFR